MGSPADYTILVLIVVLGAGAWSIHDRLGQLQRDMDALKQKLGLGEPPAP